MTPLLLGGVAAAALAVGGAVIWWWRARRSAAHRVASPEDAASAADTLPGFVTSGAVVGADGGAALAVDAQGRVAVVRPVGGRLAAREVAWPTIRSAPEGMVVMVDGRDTVVVAGVDALDVRRLTPMLHARWRRPVSR